MFSKLSPRENHSNFHPLHVFTCYPCNPYTLYTYFFLNEIPKKYARKRTSTLILPDYYEEVLAGKLEHPLSWGPEQ